MMNAIRLRREEQLGLGLAIVAHAALVGVLLLQPGDRDRPPPPERMTVSLAEEVGLTSTAPDPSLEAQAAIAPDLTDMPSPPDMEDVPPPQPVERTVAPPPPPRPQPRPTAQPSPRPQPSPSPTRAAPPRPQPTTAPRPTPRPTSGGSQIGADFLEGTTTGQRSGSGTPATRIGPAEQAALAQAINRQLKPHWSAPQGPEAELLVTVLAWELNEDGTLAGRPRVVSQSGITETNRPQAARHAEQAIRAVQLAAPFNLPPQYYGNWRRIREWRFDRILSQ